MSDPVQLQLLPLGETCSLPQGTALQDVLFSRGVEFPCGGRGLCKGCKVRVIGGTLPVTVEDQQRLSREELHAGWRLACRAQATADLRLEVAQWEAAILTDESQFSFMPQEGWGIAIDLGTTTIVAQLLDLQTGHVLGVRTALNVQAKHGADIMSRVEFAMAGDGHQRLVDLVRAQIGGLIKELLGAILASAAREPSGAGARVYGGPMLRSVVLVGNTVMHHLFCGLSVESLSHYPFESTALGPRTFSPADLGWALPSDPRVYFLPCLGGFVGSDILAGVIATNLHESDDLVALLDLGTNGEIVAGNREQLLCTSTAAGPAFEGARISMGMRAATGAISEVRVLDRGLHCHVIGDGVARGICGSGLVDAVAAGLELDWIRPNGRLANGESLGLVPPVALTQWDIRELQLAKGAIAAGLRLLLEQLGATRNDVARVFLAGAFGNYISQASARRIGLLEFEAGKVVAAGNTALLGAKMALFGLAEHGCDFHEIRQRIQHVSLKEDPRFQDAHVEGMGFPAR